MTILGFTGTQRGMTDAQRRGFIDVIERPGWSLISEAFRGQFHSGDCVGADAQAHHEARLRAWITHGHPPINPSRRAFCVFDVYHDPLPYLTRNQIIVDAADHLIATPAGAEMLHSGTWHTIRRARAKGIPITVIWPDGRVQENPSAHRVDR